jgi:hypothetical protein
VRVQASSRRRKPSSAVATGAMATCYIYEAVKVAYANVARRRDELSQVLVVK